MTTAVSMEDALKLGASRSRGAKIASAARGAGVPVEAMRLRADDYEQADMGGIRLPISDGDRPTAFSVDEPLTVTVKDGSHNPVGSVLAGSGTFTPTGNASFDAALRTVAEAGRLKPPTSKAVLRAAARAGVAPAQKAGTDVRTDVRTDTAPPDPLAGVRRELEAERRVPGAAPAPPDNSVLAQIWVKGTNHQLALRCRRVFVDPRAYLPTAVLVVPAESDVSELPVNRPLVVTLVAINRQDEPTMLQDALYMGFSFTDPHTREKYLCLAMPDYGAAGQPERPPEQEMEFESGSLLEAAGFGEAD